MHKKYTKFIFCISQGRLATHLRCGDVTLLAELLEFLTPALEMMASQAASIGLELNW